MTHWEERQAQARIVRERLKGASGFYHKSRGYGYRLMDGTFMDEAEYKKLRRECGIWWLL